MGKVLNIKDTEVYDLLVELALDSDGSVSQALDDALGAKLCELDQLRTAAINEWIARIKANPLTDDCWVELEDQPLAEPVFV